MQRALDEGFSAYQRGELAAARQHLEGVDHFKSIHLLGLVEKKAGNLEAAASMLARAAATAPNDHDIAYDQGRVARQLGRFADAEKAFHRALKLKPGFGQAGISLGRLLIDREHWDEAKKLYDALIEADPGNVPIRYGFATVLLGTGDAEYAESVFDALIEEGHDRPEFRFMRARARLELLQTEAALDDLWVSFRADPTPLTLKTLAGILWMKGEHLAFDELLSRAATEPGLLVTAAEILRQSGAPEKTLGIIEASRSNAELPVEGFVVASSAHMDTGNGKQAELAARQCLASEPRHQVAIGNLISALLMQGYAEEALQHIGPMRMAEPNRQHWIAYEAIALRLLGSPDYDRLVDIDRFVRPYKLPIPDGFDSIEAFNEKYLRALKPWHLYETHPLDQSLRGGSQTPRDLTLIDDPTIQAFIAALDGPIRQYMQDVGNGDDHPLTRRNTGRYRITGCWSVRLEGAGWHVSHVHPEGWLSSAYYLKVPEETRTGKDKAGWIQFGEPPFATIPPSPPEKWIRPEPGILVIFPSFMWHGTNPIHGGSVRVTSPFDAVPA